MLAFILFCSLSIPNAQAATIQATDCSQQAVQDAVSSASAGDTVLIPPGSCTWSGAVGINKNIILQGAGPESTIIKIPTVDTTVLSLSGPLRITQIGFQCGGDGFSCLKNNADISVTGKGWRIDHCRFIHEGSDSAHYKDCGGYAIIPTGGSSYSANPAGLIDNNYFKDARIYVEGPVGSVTQMQYSWYYDAGFGTADAVYMEDNYHYRVDTGNILDANRGAKLVWRYNTVEESEAMVHGMGYTTTNRGTRSWEMYGNSLHSARVVGGIVPFFIRNGEGFIFNNNITGTWEWTDQIHLTDDRASYLDGEGNPLCDATDPMDGNEPGESGWLCRDQIGAGKDTALTTVSGEWPDLIMTWAKQSRSPAYLWGNSKQAYSNVPQIQENRDFYDSYPWGLQTSKTSPFDGTYGVGQGTYANMPSTCTKDVAYWATDKGGNWNMINSNANDGALYKCTSANTWTLYYIPYTYPHPLRLEPGQTCSDGTPYSSCSATKPLYCSSGTLINNCQICGCPSDQTCQADGACQSAPSQCGNSIREGSEACDGTDLAGQTCISQGFSGGTLTCNSQCTGFVTTSCTSQACPYCCPSGYSCSQIASGTGCAGTCCASESYCTQAPAGLVLQFHLDEGSGSIASDSSGNGNTGTISGAVWTAGKLGNAMSFDGASDFISLVSCPLSSFSASSACFWVYLNHLDVGEGAAGQTPINLYKDSSNYLRVANNDANPGSFALMYNVGGTATQEVTAGGIVSAGSWYHICAVYNGSRTLYINAVPRALSADSGWAIGTSNMIGARASGAGTVSGIIDEVRIYSRALSSQEIQNLYNFVPHKSDTNQDGCVSDPELFAFIDRWKVDSSNPTLKELIEAIGLWKRGC